MISAGRESNLTAKQQQQSRSGNTSDDQQISSVVQVLNRPSKLASLHLHLVYANILSGAIVFSFLFIYRLNLFSGARSTFAQLWLNARQRNLSGSPLNRRPFVGINRLNQSLSRRPSAVLKFNQSVTANKRSNRDDSYSNSAVSYAGDSIFTGSEFSASSRQEPLTLQQFQSYGTYANQDQTPNCPPTSTGFSFSSITNSISSGSGRTRKSTSNYTSAGLASTGFSSASQPQSDRHKSRASPSLSLFGSIGKRSSLEAQEPTGSLKCVKKLSDKSSKSNLQRRQSAGSLASSTAKLVFDNGSVSGDDMFADDNISCASSVASSSNSQLRGNDLYPIDCSIQLESQVANPFARSASFRRSSVRRSLTSKLHSVREEHQKSEELETRSYRGENELNLNDTFRM